MDNATFASYMKLMRLAGIISMQEKSAHKGLYTKLCINKMVEVYERANEELNTWLDGQDDKDVFISPL